MAGKRSFRELETLAERAFRTTAEEETEIIRKLAEAQESEVTRVTLVYLVHFMTDDWVAFDESAAGTFHRRFARYETKGRPRRVSLRDVSIELLQDGEKAYRSLARVTDYLDRIFCSWYIVAYDVEIEFKPARHFFPRIAEAFTGGPHRKHIVEYRLVVDFVLTRTLRTAAVNQRKMANTFATAVVTTASPATTTVQVPVRAKSESDSSSSTSSFSPDSDDDTSDSAEKRSPPAPTAAPAETLTVSHEKLTTSNNGKTFVIVSRSRSNSTSASGGVGSPLPKKFTEVTTTGVRSPVVPTKKQQ